jgi:hypothetical protein
MEFEPLSNPKPEYTGVVAGMNGSPVHLDGKIMSAIPIPG